MQKKNYWKLFHFVRLFLCFIYFLNSYSIKIKTVIFYCYWFISLNPLPDCDLSFTRTGQDINWIKSDWIKSVRKERCAYTCVSMLYESSSCPGHRVLTIESPSSRSNCTSRYQLTSVPGHQKERRRKTLLRIYSGIFMVLFWITNGEDGQEQQQQQQKRKKMATLKKDGGKYVHSDHKLNAKWQRFYKSLHETWNFPLDGNKSQ